MKLLCFSVFLSSLLAFPFFAAEARGEDEAEVYLHAQLWMKESTRPNDGSYYAIGKEVPIHVRLDLLPTPEVLVVKKSFRVADVSAIVTLRRVNSKSGEVYISTQTRLSHRTQGLVAECSRYDAPKSTDIGVGSCSGRVGEKQYGVSLLKGRPRKGQ